MKYFNEDAALTVLERHEENVLQAMRLHLVGGLTEDHPEIKRLLKPILEEIGTCNGLVSKRVNDYGGYIRGLWGTIIEQYKGLIQ